LDQDFPFIAFSHEQIKTTSTQSFLLADKKIFNDIKDRILNIDQSALSSLLERMNKDEIVKAQTQQEEQCFQLLRDLDHVAGPVKGSNTSKKWMRNEIWSLIYLRGAPFWYITISPADIKHPLCIYYADKKENFVAEILPYDTRLRLICHNPVAGARFFDFMVCVTTRYGLLHYANLIRRTGPYCFSFNLLNLATPLLSYAVRLVLLTFVLLSSLP
jgi:hypothetical protein